MTPEQITEAYPLCAELTTIVTSRNEIFLTRNAPASIINSGGHLTLAGDSSTQVYYLQDHEFDAIKTTLLQVMDARIERVKRRLDELGVDLQ